MPNGGYVKCGETPWYESYSFLCGLAGAISIGAAAGLAWGWPAGAAGLVAGFIIGYCSCRISGRLKKHKDQPQVCITGLVLATGQSTPVFPEDGDRTINIGLMSNDLWVAIDGADGKPACVRETEDGKPYLHCEISSHIGIYGCLGAMIGGVAGAVAGAIVAGLIIAACGLSLLCLLLAILVALLLAAVGAELGGLLGSAAGAAADAIDGTFDPMEGIGVGDCVTICGDWVTDADHGWNEIHDIKSIQKHAHLGSGDLESCYYAAGGRNTGLDGDGIEQ